MVIWYESIGLTVVKMEDGVMVVYNNKQPGFCRAFGAGGLLFY